MHLRKQPLQINMYMEMVLISPNLFKIMLNLTVLPIIL